MSDSSAVCDVLETEKMRNHACVKGAGAQTLHDVNHVFVFKNATDEMERNRPTALRGPFCQNENLGGTRKLRVDVTAVVNAMINISPTKFAL